MVLDTSALLCVLLDGPEAARVLEAIVDDGAPKISAANWLELAITVEEWGGRLASLRLDAFIRQAGVEIIAVSEAQATAARLAWRHFGRHRHAARLDFADCFAYALAKQAGEPLLFTGEAFARTDIEPALKEGA